MLGGPSFWDSSLPLTLTIMVWVTWASSSLAGSLHEAGEELERLNAELAMARADLERRVEERTEALRASQARVIQQEKMAAFGLLAAGIAHEVGNPLAALSSLVQILKRRGPDPYTAEKLDLAARQLQRIERTIRELIDFSRPASTAVTRVRIGEVVDEALGIAKYYQRTKQRTITTDVSRRPADGHGRARLPDPGRPEPRLERDRRDRRPGTDPRGRPGRRRLARLDASTTTVGGSRSPTAAGSSSPSSRPRRMAPVWGCLSAGRSSKTTPARFPSDPSRARAPRSSFGFPSDSPIATGAGADDRSGSDGRRDCPSRARADRPALAAAASRRRRDS